MHSRQGGNAEQDGPRLSPKIQGVRIDALTFLDCRRHNLKNLKGIVRQIGGEAPVPSPEYIPKTNMQRRYSNLFPNLYFGEAGGGTHHLAMVMRKLWNWVWSQADFKHSQDQYNSSLE